jgi:hypothetical protein
MSCARVALLASALLAPAPALAQTVTLGAPATPVPGGSAPAGSVGTPIAAFTLSASSGTVAVDRIELTNVGAPAARPGTDVHSLQLHDGATYVGTARWNGTRYAARLTGLVVGAAARTITVKLAAASGASQSARVRIRVAPDGIRTASGPASGVLVTGNDFGFTPGGLEGSPSSGTARPVVALVTPGDGATSSCGASAADPGCRVQARVTSATPLARVRLSTDGGATFTLDLAFKAAYGGTANAGIYEGVLRLAPGAYALRAEAANAAGQVRSAPAIVVVEEAGTGDGNLLVRDNASELCTACHALREHGSDTTTSKYGSWTTVCRDCHAPHGTPNAMLVASQIRPPALEAYREAQPVRYARPTGAAGSNAPEDASYANPDGSGPCQVCHTRTEGTGGAARWRRSDAGGNADTHHTATVDRQRCTDCHPHANGFAPGESEGRTDCVTCHNVLAAPMLETSSGNKHAMSSAWSGTTPGSGTTVYPLGQPTSRGDSRRRCLMCHVDHELFRPDRNPSGGRGKNLRTDVNVTPTATSGFTNREFDPTLPNKGICVSCHQTSLVKGYPQPDGTTDTPAVVPSEFDASSHDYEVLSTFRGGGTNTFAGNCSKCHNDTIAKTKQTSAAPFQFGLHDSPIRRMANPMGDAHDAGVATGSQGARTLQDTSRTWTPDAWDGFLVSITDAGGTRSGVVKTNTATTLTLVDPWRVGPPVSGTTTYVIDDPPELRTCLNCHGGGVAGKDFYGVKAMPARSRRFDQFEKLYAAGTMSVGSPAAGLNWADSIGSSPVTGIGTTWRYAGSSATFTRGSSTVTGSGAGWTTAMLGMRICAASGSPAQCLTPVTWYTVVAVTGPNAVVVSPSYREATTTGAWVVGLGDWFLQCDADAAGAWYHVYDVRSPTTLLVEPAYPAPCSGTYLLRSSPGHPMRHTGGVHRPREQYAPGAWNSGADRHVTCTDCHNNHAVQGSGPHLPGDGHVAGPTVGTWGVDPVYPVERTGTATFTSGSRGVTRTAGATFVSSDVGNNLLGPDGLVYPITGYTDANRVTIGATAGYKGASSSGAFRVQVTMVKTGTADYSGTTVTWRSGQQFAPADLGNYLIGPDGLTYVIASYTSPTVVRLDRPYGVSSDNGQTFLVKSRAKTGTANYTTGSATVTRVSGDALAASDVGRRLTAPDGAYYTIAAVSGNTVTLTASYLGPTHAGKAFVVHEVGYATKPSLTTADYQYNLCIKCHSPNAYGSNARTTNVIQYDAATFTTTATTDPQSDIAWDFNPAQLAHHGVMASGRNQPPDDANPAWASSPGRKRSTYVDRFGVTRPNPNAGLDNIFVDGWGKQSRVACDDCHSSSSPEDPWGPHGSANQWFLKGIDTEVTVTLADGTVTYPNRCFYRGDGLFHYGVRDTGDRKNICLNCHRADVYGMVSAGGSATGSSCSSGGTLTSGIPYATFSRVSHPVDGQNDSNGVDAGANSSALTRFGIFCMLCHGGESLSTIHGTSAGVGVGGESYRGKRFLAGATWIGVTRATTTQGVSCWTKERGDAVSTCNKGHTGSLRGNRANYDYDSGAD